MRNINASILQIACVGAVAVALFANSASAAPISRAQLTADTAAVEKAEWAPRCWWKDTYWGPQQVCRQSWAQPSYPGYGAYEGGYDDDRRWRRHRHHHHHDDWDDDER